MNSQETIPCPDDFTLTQSLQGSAVAQSEIAAHVDQCSACQERLDQLTNCQSYVAARDEWHRRGVEESKLSPPLRSTDMGSLGDYAIESVIGVGGMGIVYRGWDLALERPVAIKVVKPDQSAKSRQRFRRESQALALIQHDHIVSIFATGRSSEGLDYLVMPLLTGGSLKELLASRPLSSLEAASLAKQIAHGLAAAHQQGLVHRDVKPANIMLETVGGRPKLMDFGLVRTNIESGLTQVDMICGTPEYMSPEQAVNTERVDARSDIYSLGVTLYECLTGVPPYRGQPLEVLKQHCESQPIDPSRLNSRIPKDLETICLKAMARKPEMRYANAQALAEDLQRFLDSRPILAKPISQWVRLQLWCQRKPGLALALAAIFILLLSGTTISSFFWARSEHNAKQSQQLASELTSNRERLRESVSRFQNKIFSDEAIHWQMSREFRAAMFQDVIAFLDEFSTYERQDSAANGLDELSEDYIRIAQSAHEVGETAEAIVAAERVVNRLSPWVDSENSVHFKNWLMLNQATRLLIDAQYLADDDLLKLSRRAPVVGTLSQATLIDLCEQSCKNLLRVEPNHPQSQVSQIATEYSLLRLRQSAQEPLDNYLRSLQELLNRSTVLRSNTVDHQLSLEITKIAARITWELTHRDPSSGDQWLAPLNYMIRKTRDLILSNGTPVTATDILLAQNGLVRGQQAVKRGELAKALAEFQTAALTINELMKLQPLNREASLLGVKIHADWAEALALNQNFQGAQEVLDKVLRIHVSLIKTDPKDNDLRKMGIEYFCRYGEFSRQMSDHEWTVKSYATAAGDCLLFWQPESELEQWALATRKHAVQQILEVVDQSPFAAQRTHYEKMLAEISPPDTR